MNDIDRAIVRTALQRLLSAKHFCIVDLRSIIEVTKAQPSSALMSKLRLLHCVNYGDMPQAVREALPELIQEAIGGPSMIEVDEVLQQRQTAAPNVIDISPAPAKRGLLSIFK